MLHKLLKFTLLLTILTTNFICSKKTLRHTFEMFRHGARSPSSLDSNNIDIFGNEWEGKGELTPVGMRMHYLLGFRNRKIYGERMNIDKFDTNEIYIISTDLNRTIESAYSQMTGFFPPGTGETLSSEQIKTALPPFIEPFNFTSEITRLGNNVLPDLSNVFPIDIFNRREHDFDLQYHKSCKGVDVEWKKRNENPIFLNFTNNLQKNYGQKIFNIINKNSSEFDLNNYDNIFNLFDSFMSGYTDGRDLSKIEDNGIPMADFKSLAEEFLYIDIYHFAVPNNYTGLMANSPLMKKVLKNMESRISIDTESNTDNYSEKNPKMYIVSAHDTNIGSFMVFMDQVFNCGNLLAPTYAASVYLELESDSEKVGDDKWSVNLLFNEKKVFSILFKEFKEKLNSKFISEKEINSFCGFDDNNDKEKNFDFPFLIINIILGMAVLSMAISVGYSLWNKRV